MKNDLLIKNNIIIPDAELEITTSRAGGPGGQHVNKTDTRITIRWNIKRSTALTDEQKQYILDKLGSRITDNGDLIVHNSESRSQHQNKKNALIALATIVRNALQIAKKRIATKIPKAITENRLQSKARRSLTKKIRHKLIRHDD